MKNLSETIRQAIRTRAGNRCEYCLCHQDYVMGQLQIDHIIPLAKGGPDIAENLCLACELCNQYKWTKTEGIDPQTKERTPLFHPCRDRWHEHFTWSDDGTKILGLTPCGRAMVSALRLNNPLAVTVRRNWVKAGWHPPQKA
jgi:hypothetical protein